MHAFDLIRPTPPFDAAEIDRAMALGRWRYSARVALWSVRCMSVIGGLTMLGRLIGEPAFRDRASHWQYAAIVIGGVSALGLFAGVATFTALWPGLRKMAARQAEWISSG